MSNTNAKVAAYIEHAEKIALEQEANNKKLATERDGYKQVLDAFNSKIAAAVESLVSTGRVKAEQKAELAQKLANNPAGVLHLLTTINEMTPTQVMAPMGPIGRPTKTASDKNVAKVAASQRRLETDQEYLASLNMPTSLATDIRRGS